MSSEALEPQRFHTIIIGAGQIGLAAAFHLAQRGVDFVVLDAAARVGDSWRQRWDSLKLFTPAAWINLPGWSYPSKGFSDFPSKDETADYLEAYAKKFSLPVRSGVRVSRLFKRAGGLAVDCGTETLEADNVIVATGPYQRPKLPAFSGELDDGILQMHSSDYRNPSQMRDGDVLVVGAATSGCQIAMELVDGRRVYLSGRSVGKVPRAILRPIFPFIAKRPKQSRLGQKLFTKARTQGHPLIGFSYKDVAKAGVERVGRTVGVKDGRPQLEGDQVLNVGNIVWSTGYKVDFSWIDLPLAWDDDYPVHERGVVAAEPGLYFVGLMFQHSLSSALLLGVDRDARYVAEHLLNRERGQAQPAVDVVASRAPVHES